MSVTGTWTQEWRVIEDWQVDELPWPGDKIDSEWSFENVGTYPLAVWLDYMEEELDKNLLYHYTGYSWDPETTTVVFHFTTRNYVQDDYGRCTVQLDNGNWALEPLDFQEACTLGVIVSIICGAAIIVASLTFLTHREDRLKASEPRRIYESKDMTQEQKDTAIELYRDAQHLPKSKPEGVLKAAGTATAAGAVFVAAIIVLILVWGSE